jgi:hypothetical protein
MKWTLIMFIALVICDGLIAGSLCVLLWKSRTGIQRFVFRINRGMQNDSACPPRTDSLVRVLMLYSIHTGLVTSVVAAIAAVTVSPYLLLYLVILLINAQYLVKPFTFYWTIALSMIPHCKATLWSLYVV